MPVSKRTKKKTQQSYLQCADSSREQTTVSLINNTGDLTHFQKRSREPRRSHWKAPREKDTQDPHAGMIDHQKSSVLPVSKPLASGRAPLETLE
jgi:hypothetical protein